MRREVKRLLRIFFIVLIILTTIILCSFLYISIKETKTKESYQNFFKKLNLIQNIGDQKEELEISYNKAYYINYPIFNNIKIDSINKENIKKLKKEFTNNNGITYETYYGPDGILNIVLYFLEYDKEFKKIDTFVYKYELINKDELKDTYTFIGDYKTSITNYLKKHLNENSLNEEIINDSANYNYAVSNDGVIVYFNKGEINNELEKITIPFKEFQMNIDITKKTNSLDEEKETEYYVDKIKKVYAKSISNVYNEDNINSEFILNLKKGEKILTSAISNNWYKIKYNDNEYYVQKKFLQESIVLLEGFSDEKSTMYAVDDIKIYNENDTKSKTIGKLSKDSSVEVLGYNKDFYEVKYNDEAGFIEIKNLTKDKPKPKTVTKVENVQNNSSTTTVPIGNNSIDSSKKMVALTFDDGPNGTSYLKILNTLEKYNAVATFFDLSKNMKNYPASSRRAESIGCEVETHTYSHPNLNTLSVSSITSEMNKAISTYEDVMGHKPYLIRAPYGNSNAKVRSTINMPFIYWTIDTLDWKSRNKNSILNEIYKYSSLDGKIILMHSIYNSTADAVSELVPKLINQGYQLVTVAQMVKYKGYTLKNGTIYYSFK